MLPSDKHCAWSNSYAACGCGLFWASSELHFLNFHSTGFSLIESLIFNTENEIARLFVQGNLCCSGLVIPDATHLSRASRWGMMRVRACCAGPQFPFDWCSFRISRSAECCNTAAKSETFLSTFQRFLSCPAAVSKLCLWRFVGVAHCHGTLRHELTRVLTDHGHFYNLAFFKSPLQSVLNDILSQFIISCLLWTCLALTNCLLWGEFDHTSSIISMTHL